MKPRAFCRTRYYYGKRLEVSDFEREQEYLKDKLELCTGYLLGRGVLEGFTVSSANGKLRVAPGVAADNEGRMISLAAELILEPETLEGYGQPSAETLTIRYAEHPSDSQYCPFSKAENQMEFGMVEESAVFAIRPICPVEEIPLALIKLVSPGNYTVYDIREAPASAMMRELAQKILEESIPGLEKRISDTIERVEATMEEEKKSLAQISGRLQNTEQILAAAVHQTDNLTGEFKNSLAQINDKMQDVEKRITENYLQTDVNISEVRKSQEKIKENFEAENKSMYQAIADMRASNNNVIKSVNQMIEKATRDWMEKFENERIHQRMEMDEWRRRIEEIIRHR